MRYKKVLNKFFEDHFVYATYNNAWIGKDSYVCITGSAQFAHIWMRIFLITKKRKFLFGAQKLNEFLA